MENTHHTLLPAPITVWSSGKKRAQSLTARLVSHLQKQIAKNGEDEPVAYIDPITLQSDDALQNLTQQCIETRPEDHTPHDYPEAIVPLQYYDGYPASPDGTPFWERLDCEPHAYFQLFKAYREDTHLNQLKNKHTTNKHVSARSLKRVSDRTDTELSVVQTLVRLYHWHERSKAYDKYQKEQLDARRAAEIEYMQDTHRAAAQKIFDKAMKWLEDHAEELGPKTALEWLQTAIELERLSLGLPKDKPQSLADQEHSDRRPWVQVNQQYNVEAKSSGDGNGNGGGFSSGTREERITAILETLHQARAIDVDPREVIDVECDEPENTE